MVADWEDPSSGTVMRLHGAIRIFCSGSHTKTAAWCKTMEGYPSLLVVAGHLKNHHYVKPQGLNRFSLTDICSHRRESRSWTGPKSVPEAVRRLHIVMMRRRECYNSLSGRLCPPQASRLERDGAKLRRGTHTRGDLATGCLCCLRLSRYRPLRKLGSGNCPKSQHKDFPSAVSKVLM